MTNVERIRRNAGIKFTITREVATASGTDAFFKLKNAPIAASPAIEVRIDSVLQTLVTHYSVDLENAIVTFTAPPPLNSKVEFTYYWSVYSDDEIQSFLDDAGDNPTIATARLLLALAADAARLAKRQTLIGGGGIGQATTDTSVAARELRETAKALIQMEADLGESIPAEGLTEVPWTEASFRRQHEQSLIRDGS